MLNVNNITTPAYICDTQVFKQNITDFREAVKHFYPNYRLGYSFKTNYYPRFLGAVKELGEYAEVVSHKEYILAKMIGFEDKDIIYNGVIPDFETKLNCALNGGLVNIDNLDEFKTFVDYTNECQRPLELGVRLNFDIGSGVFSRFGFDVTGDDYKFLLDKSNYPFISIKTVHCHFSQARSLEFFRNRVRGAYRYAKELGASIIDIGGNMFGRMDDDFQAQFPEKAPTFDEYAEAIGSTMAELTEGVTDIVLITEDGTPIVSNAMHLLCKIIGVKKVGEQDVIVVDTKREDVGASCITKIPSHRHIGKKENKVSNAIVFGCTCVEIDYILRKYDGYANIGDRLLFLNIGAYSNNTSNDFITKKCCNYVEASDIEGSKASQK